jgi:hypothetical protein
VVAHACDDGGEEEGEGVEGDLRELTSEVFFQCVGVGTGLTSKKNQMKLLKYVCGAFSAIFTQYHSKPSSSTLTLVAP